MPSVLLDHNHPSYEAFANVEGVGKYMTRPPGSAQTLHTTEAENKLVMVTNINHTVS